MSSSRSAALQCTCCVFLFAMFVDHEPRVTIDEFFDSLHSNKKFHFNISTFYFGFYSSLSSTVIIPSNRWEFFFFSGLIYITTKQRFFSAGAENGINVNGFRGIVHYCSMFVHTLDGVTFERGCMIWEVRPQSCPSYEFQSGITKSIESNIMKRKRKKRHLSGRASIIAQLFSFLFMLKTFASINAGVRVVCLSQKEKKKKTLNKYKSH